MHGIKIMYKGFHSLISLSSYLIVGELGSSVLHFPGFIFRNYLFKFLKLQLFVIVVPSHARTYSVLFLDLLSNLFHSVHVVQKVQHFPKISKIEFLICLSHSGSHAVIEIRHRLAAVLVVLIGLDRDACESRIAFYVVRLSQMSVTCGKAAFQQFHQIYLAACHRKSIEIHVVYMYVSVFVSRSVLRIYHIHLVEFFGTLGTVFQHCSHGGVAVYVGVLTFYFVFLCFLEGQILVDLHELGVHVPSSCTFRPVKDVFFRRSGMTVLYKDLFDRVLNLLYGWYLIVAYFKKI